MTVVAASLWSVPAASLAAEAARLAAAGVSRFHWDFADGSMSRAGGFDEPRARALQPPGASAEAHLMQRDPRPRIAAWASWCASVAVHAGQPHWREALELVAAAGALPVLAVTDAEQLAAAPADWGVLVMSIVPGEAGGSFDARSYDLVAAAAARGHRHIGVDGSMTPERARRFASLGATTLVSGSGLVGAADVAAWLRAAMP